jgi:hypothetical protein
MNVTQSSEKSACAVCSRRLSSLATHIAMWIAITCEWSRAGAAGGAEPQLG